MIPINVAAKSLATVIFGVVSGIELKQHQDGNKKNERDQKLLHHLRLDASALMQFSRKVSLRGKAIKPEIVGYLSTICYGHIRLTKGLIDILREEGQEDAIHDLAEIRNPFYDRAAYSIAVLTAYC